MKSLRLEDEVLEAVVQKLAAKIPGQIRSGMESPESKPVTIKNVKGAKNEITGSK